MLHFFYIIYWVLLHCMRANFVCNPEVDMRK